MVRDELGLAEILLCFLNTWGWSEAASQQCLCLLFWLQFLPGWLQECLLEHFWDKKHSPKNTQIHLEDVKTTLSVKHVETHPQEQQPAV